MILAASRPEAAFRRVPHALEARAALAVAGPRTGDGCSELPHLVEGAAFHYSFPFPDYGGCVFVHGVARGAGPGGSPDGPAEIDHPCPAGLDNEVGGVRVAVDDGVSVECGGVVGVLLPLLAGGASQDGRGGYL